MGIDGTSGLESTLRPMGPNAISRRIGEIAAKFQSEFQEFDWQLPLQESASPRPRLQGAIGGQSSGLEPINPMAPGLGMEPARNAMGGLIRQTADRYGLDPDVFEALVQAESAFNPRARSSAGALGLTQLMPSTAHELGVRDPFDPAQNLDGGARYLRQMLDRFGDLRLALAAYNAGPGAVERAGGIPNFSETRTYVDRVMRLARSRLEP